MATPKEKAEKFHKLEKEGKWKPRDKNRFEVSKINVEGIGERYVAVPESRDAYEQLQSSRGIGINSYDEMVKKVKAHKLSKFQEQLIKQLAGYSKDHPIFSKDHGFVEVGFRYPTLLRKFQEKFKFVRGYDVAPPSIAVASDLGFDVHLHDISDPSDLIDLEGVRLLIGHEVLEHTPSPIDAMKKIFDAAEPGLFVQFSVPLQSGRPQIQYAHLWEFKKGDIGKMLQQVGFKVIKVVKAGNSDCPFAVKE